MKKIEAAFTDIYRRNLWHGRESRSGLGSSLAATQGLRRELPALLDKFSIGSMFDAPCGDFHWMKEVLEQRELFYVGGDVVGELVRKLQAEHGTPTTRFIKLDITTDLFPRTDLWFCRDSLFHLPFEATFEALERFLASRTPYVLTTTHVLAAPLVNADILIGDFRPIDLFSPPYNFPRDVLHRIADGGNADRRREMCLWARQQIAAAVALYRNPR